jgi:hypothetical protein
MPMTKRIVRIIPPCWDEFHFPGNFTILDVVDNRVAFLVAGLVPA